MVGCAWLRACVSLVVLMGATAGCIGEVGDESIGESDEALIDFPGPGEIPDDPPVIIDPTPSKPFGVIDSMGAAGQVKNGTATRVYERTVALTAGVQYTFETRDLSAGSDPVLHLIAPSGVDFARSDDADTDGTLDARITVTPTGSGTYRLVLHAFKPETSGTCRIFQNGVALTSTVSFGGWRVLVAGIRDGEALETVRIPRNTITSPVMYIFDPDNKRIWQRITGGGTAGALAFNFEFLAGSRHVIFGTLDANEGTTRVVRNDAAIPGHDPDNDKLGTELEAQLNTCSTRSGVVGGFDCARTSDARDTDGDGIRDDWEVIGRRDLTPHQPLPLWGANPRHKDIFAEVDFMRRCSDAANADQLMTGAVARQMAAFYGDTVGPTVSASRRATRAADLENPDGVPGIKLHLDTGCAPTNTTCNPQPATGDETIFGNWGGHSVVPPAMDSNGACTGGQDASTAFASMARVRRGIFHYLPVYFGGGGQASEWRAYASFNAGSALNAAHEFGHSLGLGHSGRAGASFADPNCKPTYPSIMNYGYYDRWGQTSDVGFSDGRDRPTLVNGALNERFAINPGDAWYANHLQSIFEYNVDTTSGHVDWNRNGVFESVPVRAYTNYARGGAGCEWTKYNNVAVSGNSMRSPSVVRIGGYVYVFYTRLSDGRLAYTRTSSSLQCPNPVDGPCAGASFGAHSTRAVDASLGLAAVRLQFGSTPRILVTAVGADGVLRETRLALSASGGETWTAVVTVAGDTITSEPALQALSSTTAYMAFAGTDRRVRFRVFTTTGGWSIVGLAQTPPSIGVPAAPLPALPSGASPGLGWIYLPSEWPSRSLYGAFANSTGRLELYWFDPSSGYWAQTDFLETNPRIQGRPSLTWVPIASGNDLVGKLHLHYVATDRVVRTMTSFTEGTGANAVTRVGLDGPLQNTWFDGYGVSAMYEPGVDSNVRVAASLPNSSDDGKILFYPNADGLTEYPIANHNDWSVFRFSLCRTLTYPNGGTTPDAQAGVILTCEPAP